MSTGFEASKKIRHCVYESSFTEATGGERQLLLRPDLHLNHKPNEELSVLPHSRHHWNLFRIPGSSDMQLKTATCLLAALAFALSASAIPRPDDETSEYQAHCKLRDCTKNSANSWCRNRGAW